jgi:hypothetical protein
MRIIICCCHSATLRLPAEMFWFEDPWGVTVIATRTTGRIMGTMVTL